MDYLIYFFIFIIFIILIIVGLPFGRTSFNNQIADVQKQVVRENFKTSPQQSVKEGASTFYDWGGYSQNKPESNPHPHPKPHHHHHHHKCHGKSCLEGDTTYIENDYYIYPSDSKPSESDCTKCDAFRCKNIDKYVLKSSVPPCPDMSKYALKSMVKPCPDLKDYIKKSKIPPCPKCPDLRDYVRKTEIPICPPPVVCPECPVCPPAYKHIQDDPRFKTWLTRYEDEIEKKIDKHYISRKDCKDESGKAYDKGVAEGKKEAYQQIAREAGTDIAKTKKFKKCLEKEDNKSPKQEEQHSHHHHHHGGQDHHHHSHHHHGGQDHHHHSHHHHGGSPFIPVTPQEEEQGGKQPYYPVPAEEGDHPSDGTTGKKDKQEFMSGWDPIDLGFSGVNYNQEILPDNA